MTLGEAIEIKETELEGSVEHSEEELLEALKLLIGAGKELGEVRKASARGTKG